VKTDVQINCYASSIRTSMHFLKTGHLLLHV